MTDRKTESKKAYAALMKFYPLTLEDLPGELWKPIPNYEELYHESNYGRTKRFYKSGRVIILKPKLNCGDLYVSLSKGNHAKKFLIHRLVGELFIPNPNALPVIDHINGVKFDCYVGNLRWVTHKQNTAYAVELGTMKTCEEHHKAKLTNEQVIYIRDNPDKLSICELSKKFAVDRATITFVQIGKTYKRAGGVIRKSKAKHVPPEIRKQIRAEYQSGVRGCGCPALAKKYGIGKTTVLTIIKEVKA